MKAFRKISIGLIMTVLIYCLSGCNYLDSLEILEPFSNEEEICTFYGEARSRSYIDGEIVQEFKFAEWKGRGKKYHSEANGIIDKDFYLKHYDEAPLAEQISGEKIKMKEEDTFNEKQMIVYLPYKNEYSIKEISLADDVSPIVLIGINEVLNEGSLKDYATSLIGELAHSYELEIEDNVKLNGRQTQHITAVSKKLGEQEMREIWIDQNNWMVIKERIQSGNYAEEFEYLEYKFNPKIDETMFEVHIPEDASVIYIDEDLAVVNDVITVDEAPKRLGRPVFYLEEEEAELISCRYIESIDWNYGRVELSYKLADGREVIIESSPKEGSDDKIQLGYEKVKVQSQEAVYREIGEMKLVEFIKDQTLCEVYVKNSGISRNELIQIANKLKIKE